VKVEIDFSPAQLGEIAASVVAEMERQGKVMMEPVRTVPYTAEEAADVLCVSSRTIHRWIEADRFNLIPCTGRILITADSVHAIQKGAA